MRWLYRTQTMTDSQYILIAVFRMIKHKQLSNTH